MKKFFLFLALALPMLAIAAERSATDAVALAAEFMNQQVTSPARKASMNASSFKLAHTCAKLNSTAPAFYVFNHTNQGYVVVSADDRTEDVLMYSEEGVLNVENANPNLKFWLNRLQEEISAANDANTYTAAEKKARKATNVTAISPLLVNQNGDEIAWYQESPYWNQCPMDLWKTSERCLTGCVATAAAQVMYKWRHPAQGTGSHSYTWECCMNSYCSKTSTQTLTKDFSKVTFDWNNMLATYNSGSTGTDVQKAAVATLMSCCGIACDMAYGGETIGGSGAWTDDMGYGMTQYFGYKLDKFISTYASASSYQSAKGTAIPLTNCEWNVSFSTFTTYFNTELEAGRPILMGGEDSSGGGHEFVCDGRNTSGYFHINWGWEGEGNNYCLLSALKPDDSSYNFSSNIDALIGLRPNVTISVTGVAVAPTSKTLKQKEKVTLTATVAPSDATDKSVTWSSSNNAIATVSESGVVTGVAQGTATITVTTTDGSKKATCSITVTNEVVETTECDAYDYTFTKKCSLGENSLGDYAWNVSCTNESVYMGYDSNKGAQLGSSTSVAGQISFTTSEVEECIVKNINVNASMGSKGNGQLAIYIGGTQIGSTVTLTTAATDYAFENTNDVQGSLEIRFTNSAKAMYIKSINLAPGTEEDTIPTDEDLAKYYTEGQLCVCCYFGEANPCNDVVFAGTYKMAGTGWSTDVNELEKFQPVEGYEGWYVVAVDDESENIQGKPIQLSKNGSFSWDYQCNDQVTLVRGTASINAGYSGEVDITNYDKTTPVLLNVPGWKKDPCAAVYHNYSITLVSPDCNEAEYVVPAISGGFNNWKQEAMTMDETATNSRLQEGLPGAVFTYSVRAAEGGEYKFRSSAEWGKDWTNELLENNEGSWVPYNAGANYTLGADSVLTYDLGDPSQYSWQKCEKDTTTEVGNKFTKVTSEPTDWSGQYLLTYTSDSMVYIFNGQDANNGYVSVAKPAGGIIRSDELDGYLVELAKMEGGYSVKWIAKDQYMSGTSGSNTLVTGSSPVLNTIMYGNADSVELISNTSIFTFNKSSNTMRFRYYKPGTAANTGTYKRLTLYKAEKEIKPEEWTPDTISVSEARELIAKSDPLMNKSHYVYGVVANDDFGTLSAGWATVWMTDLVNSKDSLQGYKIYKDSKSTAWSSAAEIPFGLNDTIMLFADELKLYKSIYEINGGYFVEVLGKYQPEPTTTYNYTIQLYAPMCGTEDALYEPAIIGSFNDWSEGLPMTYNDSMYEYTLSASAGTEYKFRAAGFTDWSNEIQLYDEGTGEWYNPSNLILPEATQDTTIEIDYSEGKYTLCEYAIYTIAVDVPEFCDKIAAYADSVQIIGEFDGWTGTDMQLLGGEGYENTYYQYIYAKIGSDFKFRAGTTWKEELVNAYSLVLDNSQLPDTTFFMWYNAADDFTWKGCAQFIVYVESADSTIGAVSGSAYYEAYEEALIVAAPLVEGYHFVCWSDGNTMPARNVYVDQHIILTAYFAEDEPSSCIEVSVNDPNLGSADVQITATPYGANEFDSWSDGNTDNPRIVTGESGEYIAIFKSQATSVVERQMNSENKQLYDVLGRKADLSTKGVLVTKGEKFIINK